MLLLLDAQSSTTSTAFPETLCSGAIARAAKCTYSQSGQSIEGLAPNSTCAGPIASFIPGVCIGYPWRDMAARMVSEAPTSSGTDKGALLEKLFRAVEVMQTSKGSNDMGGGECRPTIPTRKVTRSGRMVISECPAATDPAPHCVNPGVVYIVANGVSYYELEGSVYSDPKYVTLSEDTCTPRSQYVY